MTHILQAVRNIRRIVFDDARKISRLDVSDLTDLEGLKKKKNKDQRRLGLTGHKSSDDEVSSSLPKTMNSKLLGVVFLGSQNIPFIVGDKCLYRLTETVIYLITSLKIKELGKLGGNFHNRYGSYIAWSCFP